MKEKINKLFVKYFRVTKPNILLSCILGFVSIFLMTVVFIQIKTVKETNATDIENMRNEELREMISSYKSKYEEVATKLSNTNEKIDEYNGKISNNQEAVELMQSELEESRLLVGKTDVQGEGVVITLKDNDNTIIKTSDLLTLVNDLNYAGAEAISINDVRIMNMSEIVEAGGNILVGLGQKTRISSPYIVKAVGNQTYLSSTLSLKDTGFIDKYKNSGKTVEMELNKNITINKYDKDLSLTYIKEVEE